MAPLVSTDAQPLEVDARGRACPVPILELARALRGVQAGTRVLLRATDPAVERDVRAFCDATGNELVRFTSDGGEFLAEIRRSE